MNLFEAFGLKKGIPDPEAPFGHDEEGNPHAPHGFTEFGNPAQFGHPRNRWPGQEANPDYYWHPDRVAKRKELYEASPQFKRDQIQRRNQEEDRQNWSDSFFKAKADNPLVYTVDDPDNIYDKYLQGDDNPYLDPNVEYTTAHILPDEYWRNYGNERAAEDRWAEFKNLPERYTSLTERVKGRALQDFKGGTPSAQEEEEEKERLTSGERRGRKGKKYVSRLERRVLEGDKGRKKKLPWQRMEKNGEPTEQDIIEREKPGTPGALQAFIDAQKKMAESVPEDESEPEVKQREKSKDPKADRAGVETTGRKVKKPWQTTRKQRTKKRRMDKFFKAVGAGVITESVNEEGTKGGMVSGTSPEHDPALPTSSFPKDKNIEFETSWTGGSMPGGPRTNADAGG